MTDNLPPLPNWLSQPPFRDDVIAYARAAIDAALATRGAVPAGWVPVTQELLNSQEPWLYKSCWIALPSGSIMSGVYEWRQGRNPDRFHTDGGGDLWAFDVSHVMPMTPPLHPSAAAHQQVAQPRVHEQVVRALSGLLEQVEVFVSAHGEADFETAEALRALEAAVAFESQAQAKPEQAAQPTQAAIDVLAERQRQISAEGWTPEHDDEHGTGEMAAAAACYALLACAPIAENDFWRGMRGDAANSAWPWDHEWLKPGEPRRMLVKAGALILAEAERLDRAAAPQKPKD